LIFNEWRDGTNQFGANVKYFFHFANFEEITYKFNGISSQVGCVIF